MNNINFEINSNYPTIEQDEWIQENSLITGITLAAIAGVATACYTGYNWYSRILADRLNKNLDNWCNEVAGAEEYEKRCEAKKEMMKCYKENSWHLNLIDLGLTSLPDDIGCFRSVKVLRLSRNKLQELPATIGQLQLLGALEIDHNHLQTLPVEIGKLRSLRTLDAEENELQILPKELINLRNLTELDINNNELQELPAEIGTLRNLKSLQLNYNKLQELPTTIGQLQKLESLEISHNHLQALPVEIGELRNLCYLGLEHNQISSLGNLVENHPERSLFSPWLAVDLAQNPIVDNEEAYQAFQALLNRPPEEPASGWGDERPPVEIHFEDFSKNPLQVLLHLSEAMTENGFPRIEYIGSPGVDAGGLTRDSITRLFHALFDPKTPQLPVKSKTQKEQSTPMILPEATLSLKEQILCYQAIGKMFALSLVRYKSINPGPHFEPIVFAMIHALSEEDLSTLSEDIEIANVRELPKEIFEKLFALYAEKVLKMEASTIAHVLNNQFEEDEYLQLACLSSIEDVYALSQIDKIMPAILVIAKSMYDYRKVLDKEGARKIPSWDTWKRTSPDELMQRIEGKLEKKDLSAAIEWSFAGSENWNETWLAFLKRWILRQEPIPQTTKKFFDQWIQKASDKQIRNFLWALTGNQTLLQGRKLAITLAKEGSGLPVFHSCFGKLDLSPREYPDYAAFKKDFEFSIKEALAQGFSLA